MKEYKVVWIKKEHFRDNINSEKIEKVLNTHAKDGWELSTIQSMTNVSSFKIIREEIMVVMEKTADAP